MASFARIRTFLHANIPAFAAVGVSTVIAVSVLPQTFLLSRYKRLVSNYDKDGKETALNVDLQSLVDRVIYRIKMKPEDEARIDFFLSYPHDPLHKGSVEVRTGAIIGLPAVFAYKTTDELAAVPLLVDGRYSNRTVDWSSEAGNSLLDSLVLSDKAKAFAIARELYHVAGFDIHVDVTLRCLFSFLAYTSGFYLNRMFKLTARFKPLIRFGAFSLVGSVWLLMYVQVGDAVSCWRDNRVDRKAARLNRVYAEGGVEFYERALMRNKAFRTLLGPSEGPRQYTIHGNEIATFRNPKVQLTARRDNLVRYLKEYGLSVPEQTSEESVDSAQ